MNIFDRVYNAISTHIGNTGKEPDNIYLGSSEVKDIMFLVAKGLTRNKYFCLWSMARAEIYGKKLFIVDAENHLSCGLNQVENEE